MTSINDLPSARELATLWNPGTSDVRVVRLGELREFDLERYDMSGLACFTAVREMHSHHLKLAALTEALHMIVHYKCDPQAVHKAMCGIREYCLAMIEDVSFKECRI